MLGDVPPVPDPKLLGEWLTVFFYLTGGAGCLLWIGVQIKRLIQRGPRGDERISRTEFDASADKTRDRFHDLANHLQSLEIRIERLSVLVWLIAKKQGVNGHELGSLMDITKSPEPS
jgi:hypothetical protein